MQNEHKTKPRLVASYDMRHGKDTGEVNKKRKYKQETKEASYKK